MLRRPLGRVGWVRVLRGLVLVSSVTASLGWTTEAAAAPRADYDLNNDGLIEINDLSDLNQIRNDPYGSSLYGSSAGCPSGGCFGYYLTVDLNFDTSGNGTVGPEDQHFTPDIGWLSIPEFYATFDGGGHVIRNLTIIGSPADPDLVQGLFGTLSIAFVRNLRFENPKFRGFGPNTGVLAGEAFESTISNISVTGGSMFVNGSPNVGGLVGQCSFTAIEESFTNLDVRASNSVGGLVGLGEYCVIDRSFVAGRVTSSRYGRDIGGLIGLMDDGIIRDSFVSGIVGQGTFVGGLVGQVTAELFPGPGSIINSYVSGSVIGGPDAGGGMVGLGAPSYTSSFFATDTTGYDRARTGGTSTAVAVTLADLKCTDTANDPDCKPGLFSGWQSSLNSDGQPAWDFGNNQQVPALRIKGVVYRDSDGDGVLDANDKFPSAWAAAVDTDNDGAPDYWREGCEASCQAASALVLDQFPTKAAAAKDLDLDGRPDAWNAGCNSTCQAASGLTLDTQLNDFDNDGTPDHLDQDDDGNAVPDVDVDSDGLMEVRTLADLANVHNDMSGISWRSNRIPDFGAAADTSGCPPRVVASLLNDDGDFVLSRGGVLVRFCQGYELLNDLDFDTNHNGVFDAGDQFWNDGNGWDSLGHFGDDELEAFQTTFEGNGHTIANLTVVRDPNAESGLFGSVRSASIRNLGLIGNTTVSSNYIAGTLVARAVASTITNVYSTGAAVSEGYGRVGALVGVLSNSVLRGAFATGPVTNVDPFCTELNCAVLGGLASELENDALVTASFATGPVSGNSCINGGLVGRTSLGGRVSGSFATGAVTGTPGTYGALGGLIGRADAVAVVASHWATDTSGRSTSAGGGQGATQAQLQCPVGHTNTSCLPGTTLYDQWQTYVDRLNRPYWHQGTSAELPGLCLDGELYRVGVSGGLDPVTPCNCSQLTQQLLTNTTFESNTAGWNGSYGTSISSSTLQAHGGARSLRVVNRNQGTWQGAEYSLIGSAAAGDSLSASVWARIAGDPSEPVQLTLRSTCQGAGTVYTAIANGTATNASWTLLSGTFTVPSCTLTELTVYVEGPRTGVELFVDDASITRNRSVCPGQQAAVSGTFNTTQAGSDWYCGELTISNPFSIATADWSAVVNLGGTTIFDMWNLNRSASTGSPTITPGPAWAKVVAPAGNSTGLGFCAYRAAGSGADPTSVVVTATF